MTRFCVSPAVDPRRLIEASRFSVKMSQEDVCRDKPLLFRNDLLQLLHDGRNIAGTSLLGSSLDLFVPDAGKPLFLLLCLHVFHDPSLNLICLVPVLPLDVPVSQKEMCLDVRFIDPNRFLQEGF